MEPLKLTLLEAQRNLLLRDPPFGLPLPLTTGTTRSPAPYPTIHFFCGINSLTKTKVFAMDKGVCLETFIWRSSLGRQAEVSDPFSSLPQTSGSSHVECMLTAMRASLMMCLATGDAVHPWESMCKARQIKCGKTTPNSDGRLDPKGTCFDKPARF